MKKRRDIIRLIGIVLLVIFTLAIFTGQNCAVRRDIRPEACCFAADSCNDCPIGTGWYCETQVPDAIAMPVKCCSSVCEQQSGC